MTTTTEVSILSYQDGPLRGAFENCQYLSVRSIQRYVFKLVEFAPETTREQKRDLALDVLLIVVKALRAAAVNRLIDADETAYRQTLQLLDRFVVSSWAGPSDEYKGSSGTPYSAQLV